MVIDFEGAIVKNPESLDISKIFNGVWRNSNIFHGEWVRDAEEWESNNNPPVDGATKMVVLMSTRLPLPHVTTKRT